MSNVPIPNDESIKKYLNKWDTLENYQLQESSLKKLFYKFSPKNINIEDILLKVSALNDFYSTNIFDTYSVAKHILSLGIDERLNNKDKTLINDIAKITNKGKIRNFYSFASKYCSHHNQDTFPIYDSYVDKMLRYYRKKDKFFKFKNDDLKDYSKFINIINKFKEYYKLKNYSLRELDIFLWLVGKEYFPNKY